jgi:hypothetical protein
MKMEEVSAPEKKNGVPIVTEASRSHDQSFIIMRDPHQVNRNKQVKAVSYLSLVYVTVMRWKPKQ